MDADARCHALAATQFGALHVAQALRCGLSERQVRIRVQRGLFRRLHPRVVAISSVPPSFEQRAMAATLYAGRGAALAFHAAGYLWGLLDNEPAVLDVWTPRTLQAHGLRFHRARSLMKADMTRLGPIPVTDLARTIIDLAEELENDLLEQVVHVALSREPRRRRRLEQRLEAVGSPGRRGPARLREVLSLCPGRVPESVWETRVFRDLRTLGKPYPVPQFPFTFRGERFRHDFFYEREDLGIECDSRGAHLGPADFERERRKLNAIQHMPWRVIHVTYRRYSEDRLGVLAHVARELGRKVYPRPW